MMSHKFTCHCQETGLSFTSFKFQIDCRGKPYSERKRRCKIFLNFQV